MKHLTLILILLSLTATASAHPVDHAYQENPEYYPHYQFPGNAEYTALVVDYIHWKGF